MVYMCNVDLCFWHCKVTVSHQLLSITNIQHVQTQGENISPISEIQNDDTPTRHAHVTVTLFCVYCSCLMCV